MAADQLQDEADVVRLAPLVVHVPAPLVAAGRHKHRTVGQVAQPPQATLASVAWTRVIMDHLSTLSQSYREGR